MQINHPRYGELEKGKSMIIRDLEDLSILSKRLGIHSLFLRYLLHIEFCRVETKLVDLNDRIVKSIIRDHSA